MKRLVYPSIFIVIILIGVVTFFGKWNTLVNFADYLFFEGPYVSRSFDYSSIVLEPNSTPLARVISGVEYEDRHWYRLNLSGAIDALKELNDIDPELVEKLQTYIAEYRSLKDRYRSLEISQSDGLAAEIVGLVNRYYIRHKNTPGPHDTRCS